MKDLTKQYNAKLALDHVNLSLNEGIYGLLGPNGAGKSTLMNILAGNIEKTTGEILYNDQPIDECRVLFNHCLGYMPQNQRLYEDFTGYDFMGYFASLKEIPRNQIKSEIEKGLTQVSLWQDRQKRIREYSGGMKQRLLLAATLLKDPKVIVLDEPTAGLDPMQRVQVRKILAQLSKEKIIIYATHVISDVELIADQFIFLKKGQIIQKGTMQELTRTFSNYVYEIDCNEETCEKLKQEYCVTGIQKKTKGYAVRLISKEKWPGKEAVSPTLEDLYMNNFEDEQLWT
ncbi:ABC transporter ATP-binding protein [Holdemania massiliensis]